MPRGTSRYDEARLQRRLWSPDVLRPSLWLDAADLSTITIGSGGVSEWRDKSGNNWNATQSLAANRPAYESFDPNTGLPSGAIGTGLPTISFDGTDDFLELPPGFLSGATTLSVALLLRGAGGSNNPIFGPASTFNAGLEILYVSGSFVRIQGRQCFLSGLYPTNNSYSITTFQASPTETTGENNGTTVTPSDATGMPQLPTANIVYSIARYATTLRAAFRMCEFVVSTNYWSVPERRLMQGYLAWKWNLSSFLPASHPYANRPPLIGD